IRDAEDALRAAGVSAGKNQVGASFAAPAAERYLVVVRATTHTAYRLTVARDAALEIEPNDQITAPQSLAADSGPAAASPSYRIVPPQLAKIEADGPHGAPYPFNLPTKNIPAMRYQQIYSKSEFDEPGMITALRFRRNEAEPTFATAGINVRIHLGY